MIGVRQLISTIVLRPPIGLAKVLVHTPQRIQPPRHLIDHASIRFRFPIDRVEIFDFTSRCESHASNLFSPTS
jgi:hypothetical protein